MPISPIRCRALLMLAALLAFVAAAECPAAATPVPRPRVLVLGDGYVSEFAWGKYDESQYPLDHPGREAAIRGWVGQAGRFSRWLEGFEVRRLDLEKQNAPLRFEDVDLVVLDEVRQRVLDPHERALIQFVRGGGGLLVYAGAYGLGGREKNTYYANQEISSYEKSPLGRELPVEILATPSLRPAPAGAAPQFNDARVGLGLPADWRVFASHDVKPRGKVLATLGDRPLIVSGPLGRGRVLVYAGDDLAWGRAGADASINAFAGTLWRRLAQLALGVDPVAPAVRDPAPILERPPAFAHPEMPSNLLWSGGQFYRRGPLIERLYTRDLLTHSCSVMLDDPQKDAAAMGVRFALRLGNPLATPAAMADSETWPMGPAGERVKPTVGGGPSLFSAKAWDQMEKVVAQRAREAAGDPSITVAHLGDEPEFADDFSPEAREAFRREMGYDAPSPKADFSPAYLDHWIDLCLFKSKQVGKMYARAREVAKKNNANLKWIFASVPQSGGMTFGDDLFHTQSSFDLLWDHTYPGTMPLRVGLNASLLEETAALQGRPNVPIVDLLQAFDSYDRYPRVPPPAYLRAMAWQGIAHGIDAVGWFVYDYCWWNLPGSEAWDEVGRLTRDVLEPLGPTLAQMRNETEPVAVMHCYSQEAVDGLRSRVGDPEDPWTGVHRWWGLHATQEAYEVLKLAHVPLSVVSEHRLLEGKELPHRVLVIPYVEHLHYKTRAALEKYIAGGGLVFTGANSPLEMPGVRRLPVSFDAKFNTWWPHDDPGSWNQRRSRAYVIGPMLEKARQLRPVFAPWIAAAPVAVDDPEVVYSVRQAGVAQYFFFINDHQTNPVSAEMRQLRQRYSHFMLSPMEFPEAKAAATFRPSASGYLYPLLQETVGPVRLHRGTETRVDLKLDGGDGRLFVMLPQRITGLSWLDKPRRQDEGVALSVRVNAFEGRVKASLPMRIDIEGPDGKQTAYGTSVDGVLTWTVPYLRAFAPGPLRVTVRELASGETLSAASR
ncbi:MAG: hypothetical protein NTW19_11445 [Planctomycetota bacterium]|nr:hypothetical protein [Planctomycetota bacterium]